jgi:tripartite-type tricarboxylate transporter receptor subunit TctC
MKLSRRRFLGLGTAACTLQNLSGLATAQNYPARPVRIVVGVPPGGTVDIIARLWGQWLTERLGQQTIIENRPGGATNIATDAVVRSTPDGYTLLMATTANAINATFYGKLGFNFLRDIALVGGVARVPLVMVVNQSFSASTLQDFIAYAKANPRKVDMASAGNGTPNHLSGELFQLLANVRMTHVPYRGDPPAITDLLGGQVQVAFSTLPAAIEHIRSGRLRALAVTTATRSELLSDVPALAESLPDFDASLTIGVGVPRNTPSDVIETLNKEINAMTASPKTRAQITKIGATVLAGSPADFGKLLAEETEKWGKVVRSTDVKVE